ncbi:hypothetical protein D3C80_2111950 [compost metagenome]
MYSHKGGCGEIPAELVECLQHGPVTADGHYKIRLVAAFGHAMGSRQKMKLLHQLA